jgi:hypothetical protein
MQPIELATTIAMLGRAQRERRDGATSPSDRDPPSSPARSGRFGLAVAVRLIRLGEAIGGRPAADAAPGPRSATH